MKIVYKKNDTYFLLINSMNILMTNRLSTKELDLTLKKIHLAILVDKNRQTQLF